MKKVFKKILEILAIISVLISIVVFVSNKNLPQFFSSKENGQQDNSQSKNSEQLDSTSRSIEIAKSNYQKGNYDTSIALFTKIIEDGTKNSEVYYFRGLAYQSKNIFDSAISDFTSAINIKSDFASAYISRGECYSFIKEIGKSLNDYTSAIHIDTANYLGYVNRGNLYVSTNNPNAAYKDYATAISINPNMADAYYQRGLLSYFRGIEYRDTAIADLTKAHLLKSSANSSYWLGVCLQEKMFWEDAMGLETNEYSLNKMFEESLFFLNRTIQLNKNMSEAYYSLGYTYYLKYLADNKKSSKTKPNKDYCRYAIKYFDTAITKKGGYIKAYEARSEAKKIIGDYKGAKLDSIAVGLWKVMATAN